MTGNPILFTLDPDCSQQSYALFRQCLLFPCHVDNNQDRRSDLVYFHFAIQTAIRAYGRLLSIFNLQYRQQYEFDSKSCLLLRFNVDNHLADNSILPTLVSKIDNNPCSLSGQCRQLSNAALHCIASDIELIEHLVSNIYHLHLSDESNANLTQ